MCQQSELTYAQKVRLYSFCRSCVHDRSRCHRRAALNGMDELQHGDIVRVEWPVCESYEYDESKWKD